MLIWVKDLFVIPIILVFFVFSRWPDLSPLNFSAAYGLVFCCGAFRNRLRPLTVFSVILFTDLFLNLVYYRVEAFSPYMVVNYMGFLAIYILGNQFSKVSSILYLVGGGLLGALLFYLISNTAAWLQNPFYAKTFMGWVQALTTGEPGWPPPWTFLRNSLLSGGFFTGLFAAVLQHSQATESVEEEEEEEAESGAESEAESKEESAHA